MFSHLVIHDSIRVNFWQFVGKGKSSTFSQLSDQNKVSQSLIMHHGSKKITTQKEFQFQSKILASGKKSTHLFLSEIFLTWTCQILIWMIFSKISPWPSMEHRWAIRSQGGAPWVCHGHRWAPWDYHDDHRNTVLESQHGYFFQKILIAGKNYFQKFFILKEFALQNFKGRKIL